MKHYDEDVCWSGGKAPRICNVDTRLEVYLSPGLPPGKGEGGFGFNPRHFLVHVSLCLVWT
jgi:hypothetical protein